MPLAASNNYEAGLTDKFLEMLDAAVLNREHGVDNIVDHQWPVEACLTKLGDRPVCPVLIVGDKVEENVGIDECHASPRVSVEASVGMPALLCEPGHQQIADLLRYGHLSLCGDGGGHIRSGVISISRKALPNRPEFRLWTLRLAKLPVGCHQSISNPYHI